MPNMTESEVFDKFAQIVAKSLRIDASQVAPDTQLSDLGAESLDLIEITMETESQFHIFLPDKSILETAVEVFGPDILEKDGYLTDEGKRLMLCRLPEADARAFQGEVAVKDLQKLFSESRHLGADGAGAGMVYARRVRGLRRPHDGLHGVSHEVRPLRPGDHAALGRRMESRVGAGILREGIPGPGGSGSRG